MDEISHDKMQLIVTSITIKRNELLSLVNVVLQFKIPCLEMEGSRPEWCISSMIYSRDTPFWSEFNLMRTRKLHS